MRAGRRAPTFSSRDEENMGETISLTTKDGTKIGAYRARPAGTPRGGMVVLQEIFGVNQHMRKVADDFAAAGYLAIAPALFDRVEPNIELGYQQADVQAGAATRGRTELPKTLLDIEAAIAAAAEGGKVGIVGYCWGGTLAFAAACRLSGLTAAVGYYGGGIAAMADEKPKIPMILQFGDQDHSIPLADIEKIKAARPEVPVYVYPGAGHGFSCDERGSFNAAAAELAAKRTQEFFRQHVG
jgi:carboxymethylenebutenolidase